MNELEIIRQAIASKTHQRYELRISEEGAKFGGISCIHIHDLFGEECPSLEMDGSRVLFSLCQIVFDLADPQSIDKIGQAVDECATHPGCTGCMFLLHASPEEILRLMPFKRREYIGWKCGKLTCTELCEPMGLITCPLKD